MLCFGFVCFIFVKLHFFLICRARKLPSVAPMSPVKETLMCPVELPKKCFPMWQSDGKEDTYRCYIMTVSPDFWLLSRKIFLHHHFFLIPVGAEGRKINRMSSLFFPVFLLSPASRFIKKAPFRYNVMLTVKKASVPFVQILLRCRTNGGKCWLAIDPCRGKGSNEAVAVTWGKKRSSVLITTLIQALLHFPQTTL